MEHRVPALRDSSDSQQYLTLTNTKELTDLRGTSKNRHTENQDRKEAGGKRKESGRRTL
jgi:hypothetical protein